MPFAGSFMQELKNVLKPHKIRTSASRKTLNLKSVTSEPIFTLIVLSFSFAASSKMLHFYICCRGLWWILVGFFVPSALQKLKFILYSHSAVDSVKKWQKSTACWVMALVGPHSIGILSQNHSCQSNLIVQTLKLFHSEHLTTLHLVNT